MDFSEELSKFEEGSKERKFFEKIFEKLGPNFLRKSIEDKKREVSNDLNNAMQSYFQSYLFATAVRMATEQFETSQQIDPSSNSVHSLYLNFVRKHLLPESAEDPKLFGLTQENTLNTIESRKLKLETDALKKQTEDNINDFCIKLIECSGGTVLPGKMWKNEFDRTIKDLEYKATLLSSEEMKERSTKQLKEMIKTYYEEITKNVLLLTKLLSLHENKLEFESNHANYYLLRCQAIFYKIKLFEVKMLDMTYNRRTIPALKMIRDQLDQKEQKLEKEQAEKSIALEQYLKLGEEYERFADEFTALSKRIKEQQWAIDELQKRGESQYGASNINLND